MMAILLGCLLGACVALLSLLFFQDEIFNWLDRIANRVRILCGLKPFV